MTNHVHLLVTHQQAGAVWRMMQGIARFYVAEFNRRHARTGTLWEGRYKSNLVDSERYVLACYRYIELNPLRATMVAHPADYFCPAIASTRTQSRASSCVAMPLTSPWARRRMSVSRRIGRCSTPLWTLRSSAQYGPTFSSSARSDRGSSSQPSNTSLVAAPRFGLRTDRRAKEATSIRRRHSERHREAFCRDPRRMPKNLRIV
jgi:hypothetical protein